MGRFSSILNIFKLGKLEVEVKFVEELSRKEVDKRVIKRVKLLLLL